LVPVYSQTARLKNPSFSTFEAIFGEVAEVQNQKFLNCTFKLKNYFREKKIIFLWKN